MSTFQPKRRRDAPAGRSLGLRRRGQPPFPRPGLRVLPDELKVAIVLFYSLLDERQRRLYAGLEAMRSATAGTPRSPSCSTSTWHRRPGPPRAARRRHHPGAGAPPGRGRPSAKKRPEVIEAIGRLMEHDTAGARSAV